MSAGRGRGRGRGIPQNRPRDPKPGTVNSCSSGVPPRDVSPEVPTHLSANAKEFIPSTRSSSSRTSPPAQAEHSKPTRLSLEQISYSGKRFKERKATNAGDITVLQHLEETVCILGTYREMFDDIMEPLVKTLKCWVIDERSMEYVVERLLDEAVCSPSFRYIGVRMCDYIDRHLEVTVHGKTTRFRSILLNKCREDHLDFQKVEKQQAHRGRWFGLCLFLGEVYRQVQIHGEPYRVIGRACMDHIECLLKDGQPDALLMAFSLFKLTGPALDVRPELRERISAAVLEMEQSLNDLGTVQSIHRQVQEIGKRTLQLRASNWHLGASLSQSPKLSRGSTPPTKQVERRVLWPRSSPTLERQPFAAEAVAFNDPMLVYEDAEFYPDWTQYYSEGDGFEGYGPADFGVTDEWYPCEEGFLPGEQEMSDEAEAAFEQFLQESGALN